MGFILDYIIPFLVMLGVLIFIHELGHFSMAKLFRVGVERFNLGFGRRILKKKWGETEYGVSIIPFGGYVKMVGEHPEDAENLTEEDISKSFMHKPPWQRALIVFFGPLSNWLLAVVIIAVIYMVGYPKPSPVIGRVFPDSPAKVAGLMPGDEVQSIDGQPIALWDDLAKTIMDSDGSAMHFTVLRNGESLPVDVQPKLTEGMDRYANKTEIWTIGVDNFPFSTQIGIKGSRTPAALAGLKTSDIIEQVNGTEVKTWHQLKRIIEESPGRPLELKIKRITNLEAIADERAEIEFSDMTIEAIPQAITGPNGRTIGTLGIGQSGLFIYDVLDDSPAGMAGLMAGDMVTAVDGKPILVREDFNEYVQERPEQPISIDVIRNGTLLTISLTPEMAEKQDILGEITSIGRIGVLFYDSRAMPELRMDRTNNPFTALYWGFVDTCKLTGEMGRFLGKLFSGQANYRGLGGPILIAKVAGDSARQGPFTFVIMLAFISINLALVNLLPLPVLDGGMLVLIGLEKVRGKPLPMRYLEWIGTVGFAIIIAMMLGIVFLDVSRFWLSIKQFFTGIF